MMMLTMMMILETWAEEDVDIDCVGEVGGGGGGGRSQLSPF